MKMTTNTRSVSVMKFENSWLPWITLRHFLPASSVRSLCATMVRDMSGGLLSLEDLVDEHLGGGDAFLETWLIRPRACSTQLASYLQRYVQQIVWQNDEESWYANESLGNEAALPPAALQFAFNLGRCDLLHVIKALPENEYVQTELRAVYDAISVCASRSDLSSAPEIDHLFKDIDVSLTDVSSQLRIATLKHLGDLFCDRDRWEVASKLHEHAKVELEKLKDTVELSDFALAMEASIKQSLAASATITDGYGAGQKMLANLLSNPLGKQAMVLSNAGLDEYVTRVRSSESIFQEDTRSAILIAPLLAESHTTEKAFVSWRAKEFSIAEGWFWSTLRRQTALGLLAASKTTKSQFASCLIDDLISRKSFDAATFKLAIGLLIEGESSIWAKEVRWSEDLLDACVDDTMCHFVIDHAEAHAGVLKHRRTVAIALFAEWARNIGVGRDSLATLMLGYLIRIGSDSNSNLRKDGADFQTCFEAVLDICNRRPEFRFGIRDELANVLARRIGGTGYWTGEDVALRLATECAPVFTNEGLKGVVSAVVALLKNTHPSDGNWVVVKPAIRLLAEGCVGDLAERDRELGDEIVREILKFNNGESDGTYAADIIFALNRYPAVLLHAQGVENQYKSLVKQALEKASAIGASNAINNMMALLVAPRAAGKDAIARTLEILGKILDSGANGKSALSFGPAYTPVRYLVAYRADICRESAMSVEDFDRSLAELSAKLQVVWDTAIEHPSIFAPLALLRKQPAEPTIVHNWVVASLELAESVGQAKAMLAKLEAARDQAQLSNGISLAFATRHAGGAAADIDVEFMSTESRGAFYAAIGRRLSALQGNTDPRFTTALFKNAIRHGPRQVDAAVFASIFPRDVDRLGSLIQELEDYKARIGENRELSLTLLPLLDRWKEAMRA
jgi:hypothetical protein